MITQGAPRPAEQVHVYRCVFLLVLFAACTKQKEDTRSVFVDPSLAYEVLSAAGEAAAQWNDAAGSSVLGYASSGARHPGQVWITRADLTTDVLARTSPPDSTDTIVIEISDLAFQPKNTWGLDGLLVHELGHAMGLGHSIHGPRDVMHPYCSPDWAITESDVRELRILHESGAFWSLDVSRD